MSLPPLLGEVRACPEFSRRDGGRTTLDPTQLALIKQTGTPCWTNLAWTGKQ